MNGEYELRRRDRNAALTIGASVVTCDFSRERRQPRADEITTGRASSCVSVVTCDSPHADEITTGRGRSLPRHSEEEVRS